MRNVLTNYYGEPVTAVRLYACNEYKLLALTTPNGKFITGYVLCTDYTIDDCDGDICNARDFKDAKYYDVHGLKDAVSDLYSKLEV